MIFKINVLSFLLKYAVLVAIRGVCKGHCYGDQKKLLIWSSLGSCSSLIHFHLGTLLL